MTDEEIIDRLGGTVAVARMCRIKPPSVSEWRRGGIPQARRQFLELLHPEAFREEPACRLRGPAAQGEAAEADGSSVGPLKSVRSAKCQRPTGAQGVGGMMERRKGAVA